MRKRHYIFLDIDIPLAGFMQLRKSFFAHLQWIKDNLKLDVEFDKVIIEESTNGNTHVFILLKKPIDAETENHLALALGGSFPLYAFTYYKLKQGIDGKVFFPKGEKRYKNKK